MLVTGAGGAVGSFVTQLAVGMGAEVIAIASFRSLHRVTRYGPATVLNRDTTKVYDALDEEVDLVINTAPTAFADLLPLVRRGGRLVSTTTPVDNDNGKALTAVRMASRSDAIRTSPAPGPGSKPAPLLKIGRPE